MYEGQELNHAFGLCHYKHFLFWNEYRSGSIYKLDTSTGTTTLLRNERPPIFEIRMYDAQQQQGTWKLLSIYVNLEIMIVERQYVRHNWCYFVFALTLIYTFIFIHPQALMCVVCTMAAAPVCVWLYQEVGSVPVQKTKY